MKSQRAFGQNTANIIIERDTIVEIIANSSRTLTFNTPCWKLRIGLSHRTNQIIKFLGQFHIFKYFTVTLTKITVLLEKDFFSVGKCSRVLLLSMSVFSELVSVNGCLQVENRPRTLATLSVARFTNNAPHDQAKYDMPHQGHHGFRRAAQK